MSYNANVQDLKAGPRIVNTLYDLNNLPSGTRQQGLQVWVLQNESMYRLNPSPWSGVLSDWTFSFQSTTPSGSFRGSNWCAGFSGNYIDPNLYSCVICGGGANGFENQLLHYPGLIATSYSAILYGYDNKGTDIYPACIGGAHNRVNTAILTTDTAFAGTAGGGTISSAGGQVTGIGTAFRSFFAVGGAVIANGQTKYIQQIASDTVLTTSGSFSPTLSGASYSRAGWYVVNPLYTPNVNNDHSSILSGTFNAIYNTHWGVIAGGTNGVLGFDGSGQVQSDYSVICGGSWNLVAGQASTIVGGQQNIITASNNCVAGGSQTTIGPNANNSAAFGNNCGTAAPYTFLAGQNLGFTVGSDYSAGVGFAHTTSQRFNFFWGRNHNSVAENAGCGGRDARVNKWGQWAQAAGFFSVQGDSQISSMVSRIQASGASAVNLSLDGTSSPTTGSKILMHSVGIPNFNTTNYEVVIVAQQQQTTDCARWKLSFLANRGSGVATTSIVGGALTSIIPDISSTVGAGLWRMGVSADTTTGDIKLSFTGAAATNIRVTGNVEATEVSYP